MKKKVYACWFKGREDEAIFFTNWDECSAYVKGLSGILYRSFPNRISAKKFLSSTNKNSKLSTSANQSVFTFDARDPATLHIYVDGSYLPSHDEAGWAWVAIGKDGQELEEHIIAEGAGVSPEPALSRNIDGEVLATLKCVEWFITYTTDNPHMGFNQVIIHHDYVGIAKWALGEWKTNTLLTQNFRTSMEGYLNILKKHQFTLHFNKVLAHSGNRWNDYVDQNAREAIRNRKVNKN